MNSGRVVVAALIDQMHGDGSAGVVWGDCLSERGISDLERGVKTRPRAYTVLQLAEALELSLEQRAVFQQAAHPHDAAIDLPPALAAPVPLPTPLTPLIGRERDEAGVIDLFRWRGARLVTLVGPGGVGKTRLALEVARRLRADVEGEITVVTLASIREPELLLTVVIEALGLKQEGSRTPHEMLTDYLRQRRVLLVLDNFEHLMEAALISRGSARRLPPLASAGNQPDPASPAGRA